jgi:DNA invertase Pin-like site-specific DNA recombinase
MAQTGTVVLARVSSKAQEDEGYSLDAQLKLIRAYCKDTQLKVMAEFRISETASKNERRTAFRQMLSYISNHNVANIVVEKTDRLARNFRDAGLIDDWLEANELRRLHMVKEGLIIHKNAKSDAKLMWNIYLAFAKKYTDNLREEAMKGWSEKLAQGWMPSPPPKGYKTAIEDGKKIHVIDQDKAFLVERAFRLYLEPGQNIQSVTDEVARIGLTTRKDRPVTKSGIQKILRNVFYIGTIHFNGRDYPGAHEPLLNTELFQAVQKKLSQRSQVKLVRHNPLFKGLFRCGTCGAVITWQKHKGRYYGCCQRRDDSCKKYPLLRHDRVEDEVMLQLDAIDRSTTGRAQLLKLEDKLQASRQPYIGQHRLGVMKMIKHQIHRLEGMEDRLYDDKLAGLISELKYSEKVEQLSDELSYLRLRFNNLEQIESQTQVVVNQPTTLCELYAGESKTGKRIILLELLTMIVIEGRVVFSPLRK